MFKEGCTFMISYKKLFELMKKQGKTTTQIREQKIIGQETLRKLKKGTGIFEEYEYRNPSTKEIEKKTREISVDTKSIESLCTWLHCQPNSIMEVIPNTWDNADRLCKIFDCPKEDLPKKVPMKAKTE